MFAENIEMRGNLTLQLPADGLLHGGVRLSISYSRTSCQPRAICPLSTPQKRDSRWQREILPPEGPTMVVMVRWGMFSAMPLMMGFSPYEKRMFSA